MSLKTELFWMSDHITMLKISRLAMRFGRRFSSGYDRNYALTELLDSRYIMPDPNHEKAEQTHKSNGWELVDKLSVVEVDGDTVRCNVFSKGRLLWLRTPASVHSA